MKVSDLKKGYAGINAGVWVGDIAIPMFEKVRFKVARLWSPAYVALRDELLAEHSDLSEDANARRVADECLVRVVLLAWDGLDEPYTPEIGRELIADPAAGSAFRSAILSAAARVGDAALKQIEADEKNS